LAVARAGDTRGVGVGGAGLNTLRWLGVSRCDAVSTGVDTWEVLVLALARLEGSVLGIVGSIVGAANTIEDVLAVTSVVGAIRVTGL
jgi:hypothetical protein